MTSISYRSKTVKAKELTPMCYRVLISSTQVLLLPQTTNLVESQVSNNDKK